MFLFRGKTMSTANTKTKTVVFTDIANYTLSTAKATRDELIRLIHDHEEHTKAIFQPYGGVIVKNLGDSFMAIFDSATMAIHACLEIVQSKMQIGEQSLAIRASLCTGDVEELNGDYFGEAVNLSSRINSKTPAGECWFANRTRLCMNQKEIPFESVGTFEFKGIPDTIECFRAVPANQCHIPDVVEKCAKLHSLKTISRSESNPQVLTRTDTIVIKGYELGTPDFTKVITELPSQIPASNIFLLATLIAPLEKKEWLQKGYGLIIGTEDAFDKRIGELKTVPTGGSSQTLFMDFGSQADVSIETIGFAVRKPINGLMKSYHYDLLDDGSWGFSTGNNGILKVDVHAESVFLVAHRPGITLDGTPVQPGTPVSLSFECTIMTPIGALQVENVQSRDYRFIIKTPPRQKQEASVGDAIEFGREPGHPGYTLVERNAPHGIVWEDNDKAKLTQRNGYTMDRIIISRQQAKVNIQSSNEFTITSVHDRIPTLVVQPNTNNLAVVGGSIKIYSGTPIILGTRVIRIVEN